MTLDPRHDYSVLRRAALVAAFSFLFLAVYGLAWLVCVVIL
jgi:hypothetical protein